MTAAPGARPANRPSRVDEVVEAAVRRFGRDGYAAVTMEDVAEECGLAVSALYYHFPGKDDLFHAAFRRVRDEVDAAVDRHGPPVGGLREILGTVFSWARAHPERARLLWLFSVGTTPTIARLWDEFVARHVAGTARYRADAGEPDPTERIAARTAVLAGNVAALHWLAGDLYPEATPEEMTEAVASMMERLLTAEV
ncbi:TetR family transcriptional regulator [Pseudonocardia acidicola]|uniref:TetR/AcrR family transcriptional regulator n=1 Tax=Pseudonocardia acidicola TaxID=2724939 RepID=A0ABX1S9F7_9PSEU|nr:TetR/AcrR family transcriptional regulator [Pseudonocardia acidicola]